MGPVWKLTLDSVFYMWEWTGRRTHLPQSDHEVVKLVKRAEIEGHESLVEIFVHLGLVGVLVEVFEGRLALKGDPSEPRAHPSDVGVLIDTRRGGMV